MPNIKIPIFIISHDRLTVLKQTINAFEQIAHPIEIVIHDNNSTYIPTLNYLKSLEESGIKVIYNKTNDLASISKTIQVYFDSGCKSEYYIVTDPDVALFDIQPDILDFYIHLLETYKNITAVGPMLKIDDIPDHYPLKERVIKSHTKQFWGKKPQTVNWKDKAIKIQFSHIDTTFAMYRHKFKFKKYNKGIRTYAPYSAQHLDWYINPNTMTEDQHYYLRKASKISHWGSHWLKKYI